MLISPPINFLASLRSQHSRGLHKGDSYKLAYRVDKHYERRNTRPELTPASPREPSEFPR